MQSNDLFDLLALKGLLTEDQSCLIIAQVVEALSICYKLGIAHRDVKLSNITFPCNNRNHMDGKNGILKVKLADFGMAGFALENKIRGRCGTPGFVAPEILHSDPNSGYNLNVDMFSVGVLTYILLSGYEPFYGASKEEILQMNKEAKYEFLSPDFDSINPLAKDFISKLLVTSGSERLTPETAKKHLWLKDILSVS